MPDFQNDVVTSPETSAEDIPANTPPVTKTAVGVIDPPNSFSIHHFVWLYTNDQVSGLPYELGPFPMSLDFDGSGDFDKKLREQLIDWGIIDINGVINSEAKYILESFLGSANWSLWGIILLYSLKTDATERFNDGKPDEFEIYKGVRDVPRVPFMISVMPKEIITGLSTGQAFIMNRIPRVGDLYKQVASVFRDILDPNEEWSPWAGPSISVPQKIVNTLAKDPEMSALTDNADALEAQSKKVKMALVGTDMSPATSKALVELTSHKTIAAAQVCVNYESSQGQITPSLSTGISFFDGAGVVVSHPHGNTDATRSIRYVPGNVDGFAAGVKALISAAEYELR